MMREGPRLAAIAVLTDGKKVLLARRSNPPDQGHWGFPGGKVELGESVYEAAVRELAEETTIRATAAEVLANLDVIGHDDNGQLAFHYHLVAVRCVDFTGTAKASDDVSEACWHPIAAVFEGHLPLSKNVDHVLRQALSAQAVTASPIT